MRDAFGGTFMIQLLIIFIIIYIGFTAVALNYAKAFKAKNAVIEYLEQNEISSLNDLNVQVETAMLDYIHKEVVGNLNYIQSLSDSECVNTNKRRCYNDVGIVIEQITPSESNRNKLGTYYRVTTYFGYDISFFKILQTQNGTNDGQRVTGKWTIVGETRPIAYE